MRNFKSSESKLKPNLAVPFATNYNSKRDCVFNAKSLKDILAHAKNIPSFIIITNLLVGFKSKVRCLHSTLLFTPRVIFNFGRHIVRDESLN